MAARSRQDNDKVTYFFLIKRTDRGAAQSRSSSTQAQKAVTRVVKRESGKPGNCKLYLTQGGAYDYLSIVTNISAAGVVRVAEAIEKGGYVKATLLSGIQFLK